MTIRFLFRLLSVNPITEKHSFQMATHTPVQVNFDSSCDVIKDGPLARFVRRKKSWNRILRWNKKKTWLYPKSNARHPYFNKESSAEHFTSLPWLYMFCRFFLWFCQKTRAGENLRVLLVLWSSEFGKAKSATLQSKVFFAGQQVWKLNCSQR